MIFYYSILLFYIVFNYFFFFIATFFISEINLEFFNNIIENFAPEGIQDRTSGYRNEKYVEIYRESTEESRVWYARWYGTALKWSVMGFLVVLFFQGKDFLKRNKNWLTLFCFTLLFYGVANLLSSLPSAGRFVSIANLCALTFIILFVQNNLYGLVLERFIWSVLPALTLYIIVAIRIGLYSMSATAILGNPIISMFFVGEHISINDFIKSFI